MPYVLRFVQRFGAKDEAAFMALEAEFAALEVRKGWPRGRRSRPLAGREPAHTLERRKGWPEGRRSRPVAGREPANTLVWECELATLGEVNQALATLERDPDHARLLRRQVPFFQEAWTEVYEVLEFQQSTRAGRRRPR
jgi:hypothetical protein